MERKLMRTHFVRCQLIRLGNENIVRKGEKFITTQRAISCLSDFSILSFRKHTRERESRREKVRNSKTELAMEHEHQQQVATEYLLC